MSRFRNVPMVPCRTCGYAVPVDEWWEHQAAHRAIPAAKLACIMADIEATERRERRA